MGGSFWSNQSSLSASQRGTLASSASTKASLSAVTASFQRRREEWEQQRTLATKELKENESQVLAAAYRREIAEKEFDNHELQIENAKEVEQLFRRKFTNKELYDWMLSRVSGLYFKSYQLAYDMAKRAEGAFQHELGIQDSDFIQFGYWDSMKKGLLSGEKLSHDLKRMEASYLDHNRREYELTKTTSLALLDPVALLRLKQTGECFVILPEAIFDQDYPGHYMRRIKSVGLSIPCVTGPYSGVHCTLTLVRSSIRKTTSTANGYPRTHDAPDGRFLDSGSTTQSIATSEGVNDHGMFELNFRDERYLPFEGEGVVASEWRIVIDKDTNRFDFDTITDVLMHISYTAREGGDALKAEAKKALTREGWRIFSIKHELPDEWHRFLHPAENAETQSLLMDVADRFGARPEEISVDEVRLYLRVNPDPLDAREALPVGFFENESAEGQNLLEGRPLEASGLANGWLAAVLDPSPAMPGRWLVRVQGNLVPDSLALEVEVGGAMFKHLNPAAVSDAIVVCHFGRA